MAKRKRQMTEEKIQRWIKEGRGQGTGTDYKSWLNIQDVASSGNVHRRKGIVIDRVYQLLSNLENDYLSVLEIIASTGAGHHITDIREQYPILDRDQTKKIAGRLGVKHPTDPQTQVPIVMTTDFVITVQNGYEQHLIARTVKTASDLKKNRTLEKLEIERIYWQKREVDWGIVTREEIPQALAKNARYLSNYVDISQHDIARDGFEVTRQELHRQIDVATSSLNTICQETDKTLKLKKGTALTIALHLIATGDISINLLHPFKTIKILQTIG